MRLTSLLAAGALVGSLGLGGCGLDGVRGELVRMEGREYVLKTPTGEELRIAVDEHTRKDRVEPGDDIRAFVTRDGHAAFVQRLGRAAR